MESPAREVSQATKVMGLNVAQTRSELVSEESSADLSVQGLVAAAHLPPPIDLIVV